MRKYQKPVMVMVMCCSVILFFGIYLRNKNVQPRKYSESKMLMGTFVRFDVCQSAQNINTAYEHVWKCLEDISWRMNVYDDRSDVARINDSNFEPVFVGKDTYSVLERSKYFSKATGGAFDITVRPLIELWRDSVSKNILSEQKILI